MHREPDSSSAEKLVKQIFWLYYDSVTICFPFPDNLHLLPCLALFAEGAQLQALQGTQQDESKAHNMLTEVFAEKRFSF